ncbi:MAG: hypothetical protein JWM22_3145 [Frankiales bacterium]|nr:hypothetical protein [Frankiales bacterium]
MPALRRSVPVLLAAGSIAAVALTTGPTVVTAKSGPVLGPSGKPAVERTYKAGQTPGEEEAPLIPPPDAVVADRDSVADQVRYAQQAAGLPQAEAGRTWTNPGPFGQDDPPGYPTGSVRYARAAGMGTSVAVDPRDTSGQTVYIGNMGGLWKSTNGGTSWKHLGESFLRSAVGAIAVDPLNPDNVYVGTGIALLTVSGDAAGAGVYVSHDAGKTFTRPAKNVKGYGSNAVTVTPSGVLVGTNRGLWLSRDKGGSFTEVKLPSNATHTGQATGAYSNWVSATTVEPDHPLDVTVAVGMGYGKRIGPDGKPLSVGNGLYRSTTGAQGPYKFLASTSQLTNPQASNDPVGRIALAYGAKGAEFPVLWALVSDAGLTNKLSPAGLDLVSSTTGQSLNRTNSVLNGLYRSDDNGVTWTLKATPAELQTSVNESLIVNAGLGYGVGVQGFYNLWVQGDPVDNSKVYLGLEEVFQSTANTGPTPGRGTFEVIQRYWDLCGSTSYFDNIDKGVSCPDQTPYYGGVSTHPDQHVGLAIKTSKGVRLYTGNDGGFFREDSHPLDTGGTGFDNDTWVDMNHLATTQAWHIARKTDGEYLVANQDNGAGFFKQGGSEILVSSGDGLQTAATANPDVWYSSAQGLILYVTKNHGRDITNIAPGNTGAGFLSPFAIDPTDDNHLVAAAQDVKESTKGASTQVLADPLLGTVVSSDWTTSFDQGNSPYKNGTAVIPWGAQGLAVRGAAVYVGSCALCRNSLGDPKLINSLIATNVKAGCTAKKGSSDCWHKAKGIGLPHVGVWTVTIDPTDVRTIYVTLNENSLVGLDKRVVGSARLMVSHDAGDHFTDITGNLPGSNTRDVVVRNGQLIVATDNGVFIGPRTGKSWARLGKALPQVRMFDLDLDRSGRYLTASAYGRGVWVLDFGGKATTSSSGPGLHGGPTSTKGVASGSPGGRLAATGLDGNLAVVAVLLMVAGGVTRARRSRKA